MGQAYQDGGKWWVPWTGEIVPLGAEFQDEGKWNLSQFVGLRPANFPYRIPATQEQIDAALRAERQTGRRFSFHAGRREIGQAFKNTDGRWIVLVEDDGPADIHSHVDNARYGLEYGWIGTAGMDRDRSLFNYARYATQDEIDAALRAESGASVTEVRPDGSAVVTFTINPAFYNPDGWIEKSWGRTRQVFAAEGVEVWESEGKAGHRTSWHKHPNHAQSLTIVSGRLDDRESDRNLEVDSSTAEVTSVVDAGHAHELRFLTDCRFIEVYTGTGSVMDTIERIYK